jgi:hypothetical protein
LATTTDLRWELGLSRRWSVWPHLRLHAQSAVSFWRRAYAGSVESGSVVVPELRSGDRELSPLWSGTFGPGLGFAVGGSEPDRLAVSLEIEGTYTSFRDALYIDHRWAGFAVAGFSARLP